MNDEKKGDRMVRVLVNKRTQHNGDKSLEEKIEYLENKISILSKKVKDVELTLEELGVSITGNAILKLSEEFEPKQRYGKFKNVLLTDKERRNLDVELGTRKAEDYIESLSTYLKSKGKRYKSHYATILNWHRRRREEANGKAWSEGLPDKYTESPDY